MEVQLVCHDLTAESESAEQRLRSRPRSDSQESLMDVDSRLNGLLMPEAEGQGTWGQARRRETFYQERMLGEGLSGGPKGYRPHDSQLEGGSGPLSADRPERRLVYWLHILAMLWLPFANDSGSVAAFRNERPVPVGVSHGKLTPEKIARFISRPTVPPPAV